MRETPSLDRYLDDWSGADVKRQAVAQTIRVIAGTGRHLSEIVAQGQLAGAIGDVVGSNSDGDAQKQLDIRANDLLIEALIAAPVATIASEELTAPLLTGQDGAELCVAIDPLDGSSNIDTNTSIGTIFSVLPVGQGNNGSTDSQFFQPGTRQLAAGYIIYGPQTALVLTLGEGTQIFVLDRSDFEFRLTSANVQIPAATREFAINASNHRFWDDHIQLYISDCLTGEDGPRKKNFNMRWNASLVAECHRILSRGGIFLYPGDTRQGYQNGRLRLLYEAGPIAMLIEQAGGGASTGLARILDIQPSDIHQRVPFIFGSKDEVEHVERRYACEQTIGERSPLFARRGLFRA
ncbi:fructose-1,6-bisphosphatase class 1 [bacterium MnTg02]|nr:fructose-1,6-bisphosphatase class 1 [bacterium MnTg02]